MWRESSPNARAGTADQWRGTRRGVDRAGARGSPSKVCRPWSPKQTALLPASKLDYLGSDRLAVCLLDVLPTLHLPPILDADREDRGQPSDEGAAPLRS